MKRQHLNLFDRNCGVSSILTLNPASVWFLLICKSSVTSTIISQQNLRNNLSFYLSLTTYLLNFIMKFYYEIVVWCIISFIHFVNTLLLPLLLLSFSFYFLFYFIDFVNTLVIIIVYPTTIICIMHYWEWTMKYQLQRQRILTVASLNWADLNLMFSSVT